MCSGASCLQGKKPCATRRQCGLSHATTGELIASDGGNLIDTDSDLEMVGSFGIGTGLAAFGIVALIVAAVWLGDYFSEHWATLVAYMT